MDRKNKLRTPGGGGASEAPDDVLVSGGLRVDLADQRLSIDGETVTLAPKVYELLILLLSQPQRVHTREVLFERLWPQSVLLDANLTTTVSQLRKALTEPLRAHLRTVPRVGYSWDAEVRRLARAEVDASPDLASALATATADVTSPARETNRRRGWSLASLVAVALTLLLAAGVWKVADTKRERPIVLLEMSQPADRKDTRAWMPAVVVDAVRQQLQLSPNLRVLSADDSAGLVASNQALGADGGADYRLRIAFEPAAEGQQATVMRATLTAANGTVRDWRAPIGERGLILAAQSLARDVSRELLGELPTLQQESIAPAAVAAYEVGMRAENRGQRAEARRHYEEAIALSPGFASARVRLADTLADLGLYDLAAAQWQAAADDRSLGPEARGRARAQGLHLTGKPAAAAKIYDDLAQRFPDEPAHRLAHIDSLIRAGGNALAQAERALEEERRAEASPTLQVRWMLLEARLHGAHGRGNAEFEAYRRAADASALAKMPMLLGDAQLHLGLIHRGRNERDAAARAFSASAAAFRTAGSETHAQAAELNRLLLPPQAPDPASRRVRAETLENYARLLSAQGSDRIAGQALDAAAADWLSLNDLERGRELASRAEALLRNEAPALRAGPQTTLALADLQTGLPRSALRKLNALQPKPGTAQDVDLWLMRVRAWRDLGEPLRAYQQLRQAQRGWESADLGAAALKKIACTEMAVALHLQRPREAKTAMAQCDPDDSNALAPARAELAMLEADSVALAAAERVWRASLESTPSGEARVGMLVALVRFRAENGDEAGATLLHRSIDNDALGGLTSPLTARYWLNTAVLAAFSGDTGAFRSAMARADRAIGPELAGLRRDFRLLQLADGGARNRESLAAFARETEAAGAVGMARRATRLAEHWQRAPNAWSDTAWWCYSNALR